MAMTDAWPEGWYPVERRNRIHAWEKELQTEVGPRHILWQHDVRLIARRDDRDDALFELGDGRVAEVHLTWTSSQAVDEKSPWTIIFPSLSEWRIAKSRE